MFIWKGGRHNIGFLGFEGGKTSNKGIWLSGGVAGELPCRKVLSLGFDPDMEGVNFLAAAGLPFFPLAQDWKTDYPD